LNAPGFNEVDSFKYRAAYIKSYFGPLDRRTISAGYNADSVEAVIFRDPSCSAPEGKNRGGQQK